MDAVVYPMLRQMKALGINAKFMGGDGICPPSWSSSLVMQQPTTAFCAEAGGVEGEAKVGMDEFKKKFRPSSTPMQVYAPTCTTPSS